MFDAEGVRCAEAPGIALIFAITQRRVAKFVVDKFRLDTTVLFGIESAKLTWGTYHFGHGAGRRRHTPAFGTILALRGELHSRIDRLFIFLEHDANVFGRDKFGDFRRFQFVLGDAGTPFGGTAAFRRDNNRGHRN